jgi:hypothetical protein
MGNFRLTDESPEAKSQLVPDNEKPRPMGIKGRGLLSLGEIDVLGEASCPNPTIGFAGNNSRICNLLCRADPLVRVQRTYGLSAPPR